MIDGLKEALEAAATWIINVSIKILEELIQ